MVITGLNSAGCFCSDMGDVVISGLDADIIIDFTVNRNAYPQSTWSERFRPNSLGEVRISELGNIAKDYFIPMGLTVDFNQVDGNSFSYNVGIIAIVKDAEGNQLTRFAQQFYYATQKVGLLNSQYKFFYNRYNKRSVHPNQYITVGYNLDEQDFKVGVAFYASGGNLDYFVFDYGQEDNQSILHRIRNLSPEVIANKLSQEYDEQINVSQLIYYDAQLYYNSKLIDKIHFEMDHKHYKQLTHFVFYNMFGFPETIYMTGKDEKSAEMEGTYALISEQYTKIDTELNELHTVNSGYISETSYESIKDMIRSREVYRYNGTYMERITITDVDLVAEKPRSTPLNVKITYRLAKDDDAKFIRPGMADGKVFDETFDNTFA